MSNFLPTPITKEHSGFSLIEVMVSISLLLIALVGPMTFFARSSQSTEIANDRAIATFLAQEGAELIQKLRDDRSLQDFFDVNNDGWNDFLADVADCVASPCGVSITDAGGVTVIDCESNSCVLRYDADATRARFNHTSGDATQFTRLVQLNPVGTREVEILSRVEWDTTVLRDRPSVEIQTSVFNVFIAE